jgi:hypothetical protein
MLGGIARKRRFCGHGTQTAKPTKSSLGRIWLPVLLDSRLMHILVRLCRDRGIQAPGQLCHACIRDHAAGGFLTPIDAERIPTDEHFSLFATFAARRLSMNTALLTIIILIALAVGGGLTVKKACKTGHYTWCVPAGAWHHTKPRAPA